MLTATHYYFAPTPLCALFFRFQRDTHTNDFETASAEQIVMVLKMEQQK